MQRLTKKLVKDLKYNLEQCVCNIRKMSYTEISTKFHQLYPASHVDESVDEICAIMMYYIDKEFNKVGVI